MAALNEAYEVLSDEGMHPLIIRSKTTLDYFPLLKITELRARFDNGDDPNDPTSGQGTYGNPFVFFQQSHGHGRGNPLGGNPFGGQFKFSFQH